MAFETVGDTLNQSFHRGPIHATVLALKVEVEAKKILPSWATMISFREGRLLVSTPSPSHAQELYLNSAVLIRNINEALGGKVVEKISFRAGAETSTPASEQA